MRLVHFVHQGRTVGGLEQLLADVLAADAPGLEHAVVQHWGDRCEFAGRWPTRTAAWSAEGDVDVPAVLAALRDLNGTPLFHAPPATSVARALGAAGIRFGAFCHGHDWWCASGSRYYSHVASACAIRGSTLACSLRYYPLGCGSLRPRNVLGGLGRAEAGRGALASASAVIVLSEYMGSEARRHGAREGSVHRIPAPTSLAGASFVAGPAEPRALYASRLTREKGVLILLEAFVDVGPGVALDIAGTGIGAAEAADRVARHPFRDRIRLLGAIDRGAVREAIARASVVVVPSAWPEPFGIVGIEALALGRPVVASDVGGIGEWAQEELGALRVPADDARRLGVALRRVIQEPEWAARARSAGAAWVRERHSPMAAATALARVEL